jgi:hypothetical protein
MTPTDHRDDAPLYSDPHVHDRFHAEHGHGPHDDDYNEDVAHEHSDVNVRALLIFAAGLAAVVVMCAGIVLGMMNLFERQAAANDAVMSPLARPAAGYPQADQAPAQVPQDPRLLTNEPRYLQQFRAQEAERLKGIEDAKKKLLESGLPVRADAPQDGWMGTRSPTRGESTGGRGIPVKPGGN